MTDNDSSSGDVERRHDTAGFVRGVGAAGDTLDDLDSFVQDARRAGIPGDSPVWSSTAKGFSLSTGSRTHAGGQTERQATG